jgi:hypothetical protein
MTTKATAALAVMLGCLLPLDFAPRTEGAADAAARARMRAEFQQLHAVRQRHRGRLLALPGVVGLGTETRDNPRRVVITVYVTQKTPELRAAIESRLQGVPVEIIEQPGGFSAF